MNTCICRFPSSSQIWPQSSDKIQFLKAPVKNQWGDNPSWTCCMYMGDEGENVIYTFSLRKNVLYRSYTTVQLWSQFKDPSIRKEKNIWLKTQNFRHIQHLLCYILGLNVTLTYSTILHDSSSYILIYLLFTICACFFFGKLWHKTKQLCIYQTSHPHTVAWR